MAPMSSLGAPHRVLRNFAARRSRSSASLHSATPFASGIDPSATQARRASSERWKSACGQRTPPPARA
eukprot:6173675-Pleurochrysis_carterae.AAC.1